MRELRQSDFYASVEELKYGTTNAFVSGNNAYQLEVAPEVKKKNKKKTKLHIVEPKKPRRRRELYTKAQIMRNRATLFITVTALALVCMSCFQFLKLQALVSEKNETISKLEKTYDEIKRDNDLMEVEINSSIDYNLILDVAINQLGMVCAQQDQIVTYESSKMEVVRQLGSIPKE